MNTLLGLVKIPNSNYHVESAIAQSIGKESCRVKLLESSENCLTDTKFLSVSTLSYVFIVHVVHMLFFACGKPRQSRRLRTQQIYHQ